MAIAAVYSFGCSIKIGTSWISTTWVDPGYYIINCPICRTRGLLEYPRTERLSVGLLVTKPGTLDDVLRFGVGTLALSSRAQAAIRRSTLSGMRWIEPVEVACKGSGPAWNKTVHSIRDGGYKIANMIGVGGSVAKLNNVKVTKLCPYCGWVAWSRFPSHLLVDSRQWDGSDFFVTEEYRARLMTQRAADALAAEGLTGCTPELEGSIIDPRKPVRAPTRKQRYDTNNMYVLTAIYGDPAERAAGVYKPFWTDFLAGKLGERTLSNALRKVKKFRPSGKRWISDWKPLRP